MRFATLLICASALCAPLSAAAQERPGDSVFSGAPAETATLPNGAIINARYLDYARQGGGAKVMDVAPGLWTIRNYSIVNCIVVETANGLVIVDTGTNVGEGETFLKLIRERTSKPILAIIYSHSHYTGGARAMLTGANKDALTIGHPKLEANFASSSLALRPATARRANMQFGAFLPATGPDARIAPPAQKGGDPAKLEDGHVAVRRTVGDGEALTIDGTEFVFYHAQGDTDDTLTVHVPRLSAVLTNVIARQFFAMSTLRGERFRDPQGIIDSYERIRQLAPEHYLPTHGDPLSGKAAVNRLMTVHRDAYAFTLNQAIRGINKGWTPDEIVARTPLPKKLADDPSLFQGYSEYAFALRGIYAGLIGWFAEDTADLHPPSQQRVGAAIAEGFGGVPRLVAAANAALARKEYDLAAKLAGYAVYAAPQDMAARTAKAAALRAMARVGTGMQAHNFYLTEALELEGKTDSRKPVAGMFGETSFDSVRLAPPLALVRVLESRIDPARAIERDRTVQLTLSDVGKHFAIEIRNATVDVREISARAAGPSITTDRRAWFDLIAHKRPLAELVRSGGVKLSGQSLAEAEAFMGLFDPL